MDGFSTARMGCLHWELGTSAAGGTEQEESIMDLDLWSSGQLREGIFGGES